MSCPGFQMASVLRNHLRRSDSKKLWGAGGGLRAWVMWAGLGSVRMWSSLRLLGGDSWNREGCFSRQHTVDGHRGLEVLVLRPRIWWCQDQRGERHPEWTLSWRTG